MNVPATALRKRTCTHLNEVAPGNVRGEVNGVSDRARAVLQRRDDVVLRGHRTIGSSDRNEAQRVHSSPPTWTVGEDVLTAAAHGPELKSVVDADDE